MRRLNAASVGPLALALLLASAAAALEGCAPCGGCASGKVCTVPFDGVPEVCLNECDDSNRVPCPADRVCVIAQGTGGPTCARRP